MNKIAVIIFAGMQICLFGCEKREPIKADEKAKVLEVEKMFVKAVIEKDKDAFLRGYADNTVSQSNAAIFYELLVLHRELFSVINEKFGKEGWSKYRRTEGGSGDLTSKAAELELEGIDDYIQTIKLELKHGKAIAWLEPGVDVIYRKEHGRLIVDIRDDSYSRLDEDNYGQHFINGFHGAIKEVSSPESTIESIAKAYRDSFNKQVDKEL